MSKATQQCLKIKNTFYMNCLADSDCRLIFFIDLEH